MFDGIGGLTFDRHTHILFEKCYIYLKTEDSLLSDRELTTDN